MFDIGKIYRYGLGLLLFILGSSYLGSVALKESTPEYIVIDYSATIRGNIEACGCPRCTYGGLARRATYIKKLRKDYPDLITVFNGDLGAGASFQEQVRTDFMYLALEKMKCDVFNIGEEDFLYGLDYLKEKIQNYPIFISANLLDSTTQKPFVEPYRIKTVPYYPDGIKKIKVNVAIFGLLGLSQISQTQLNLKSDSTQFTLAPPLEIARKLVPELKKKADIIICLAHMTPPETNALAQEVPGIDIIISGHESFQMVGRPRLLGNSILVNNGDRGRFGGLLKLKLDKNKQIIYYRGNEVALTADFAKDTAMVELLNTYKKAISGQP